MILELQDVTVRYGRRVALEAVTASVEGGAVGLLGPNGAGKSTLIKAVLGLVPTASGSLRVLDRPANAGLRRHTGYMPERDAAFPGMTGFQATWYAGRLAGMPDADARRRAHEVLLFAGLEEARYRDVGEYSTGMRQRVKLAQALVHDPDLLFLDEPTNGLDPRGRVEMLDLIKLVSREKGMHVVLSSHLLRDVEDVCSSVLVMQDGRLVRSERIDALKHAAPDACSVRLVGPGVEAFGAACAERGVEVLSRKERDFELRMPSEGDTAPVFAAADASDVVIRSLRPVQTSLEDAIADVLEGVG